ncbi:MAG: 5-dehydro-4-deoxy-D-glucuronate isomerase [Firmicutes bacterium]|nr:5-dehydro-4-deoxy-D-glucuronate isomerase [Bacillota bacterium]
MEIRYAGHPKDVMNYPTDRLRRDFLIQGLFSPGEIKLVYSHYDRMIVGGACPAATPIPLPAGGELKAEYFLERRELGLINVGPKGTVTVDGRRYELGTKDALYIGQGAREVLFASADPEKPARFYFLSTPAHRQYPTEKIDLSRAEAVHLGSLKESNERTIYKFIHPQGVKSCQLVMGLTALDPNNVWNSMPCHTHERRMEVYFYFELPPEGLVFHFMGEPKETRHLVVRNEEAVIAPSWSIHAGVGTTNYSFIWGMAGENQTFSDMDGVPYAELT